MKNRGKYRFLSVLVLSGCILATLSVFDFFSKTRNEEKKEHHHHPSRALLAVAHANVLLLARRTGGLHFNNDEAFYSSSFYIHARRAGRHPLSINVNETAELESLEEATRGAAEREVSIAYFHFGA
jgi:hypothetical protein